MSVVGATRESPAYVRYSDRVGKDGRHTTQSPSMTPVQDTRGAGASRHDPTAERTTLPGGLVNTSPFSELRSCLPCGLVMPCGRRHRAATMSERPTDFSGH